MEYFTDLIPEIWTLILDPNMYRSLLQTSKPMGAYLESSFVIGSYLLEEIIRRERGSLGGHSVCYLNLRSPLGEHACMTLYRGEAYKTPRTINLSLLKALISTLFSKNYLYKLLLLNLSAQSDHKMVGLESAHTKFFDNLFFHLCIHKPKYKETLLHVNTTTKMLCYTTRTMKSDLQYHYAEKVIYGRIPMNPLCDSERLANERCFWSKMHAVLRENVINMNAALESVENVHTHAPNILLFETFYDRILKGHPIEDLENIGLNVENMKMFDDLDPTSYETFFIASVNNEKVCKKIIPTLGDNMCTGAEGRVVQHIIRSKNMALIECLFKHMMVAPWLLGKEIIKFLRDESQNAHIVWHILDTCAHISFDNFDIVEMVNCDITSNMRAKIVTRMDTKINHGNIQCWALHAAKKWVRENTKWNPDVVLIKFSRYFVGNTWYSL